MSLQVLILQSDAQSTEQLTSYFAEWQDQVWHATNPAEALALLKQQEPELVVVDLHLLNNGWEGVVPRIQEELPNIRFLFTTAYPDSQKELQAKKDFGARVFLRSPFTRTGLEQALRDLEGGTPISQRANLQSNRPKVQVPVRTKITLPYVVLAIALALAAAYVVSQIVLDTVEERFTNQLIEAGKLTSDWIVNEEDRLLETLRLLSHTREVPEAVAAGDAEQLREIMLPLAVNYQEEAIEILDMQGTSLLSLRHRIGGTMEDYEATRGETIYTQWQFVQNVLQQRTIEGQDKYAGLARSPWGDYIYVSGPILDSQGEQVGVILVGKSISTLVNQIRQDTFAHITLYDLNGKPIASTLFFLDDDEFHPDQETISGILERQFESSLIRPLKVASIDYSEILGPWEVGENLGSPITPNTYNDMGLAGVSLAQTFLARPGQITRMQIFVLTAATFLLVIILGVFLANRITRPLLQVVTASAEVARGNLDVQVEPSGNDEVAVLAHSFNEMVASLREGSVYRDLFGRTVSPEVREQLRQGFAAGDVNLEGQEAIATVLVSDIRNFTSLSESESPTTIMGWLNEYFEELVPIINNYGGVVSKFEGDAVLAFFGILPRPLSDQEGAYRACQAALTMLETIVRLNDRRAGRGDPVLKTGIGINTGPVIAGALGSTDRLHYTIIGDTVNTTARLEDLTRQFGKDSGAVISQHTLFALRERRHEFELEAMGSHTVKGKVEQLLVYRLQPCTVTTT